MLAPRAWSPGAATTPPTTTASDHRADATRREIERHLDELTWDRAEAK